LLDWFACGLCDWFNLILLLAVCWVFAIEFGVCIFVLFCLISGLVVFSTLCLLWFCLCLVFRLVFRLGYRFV